MKSNHDWTGVGVLLDQYYQTWADYHLKCIEAYDKLGIPVWGLTTGNEPSNGFVQAKFFRLNDMGWTVFSAVSNTRSKLVKLLESLLVLLDCQ